MLIDNPEPIFVDRKNERISNLAEGPQCSQGLESRSGLRLVRNRWCAAVIGNRLLSARLMSNRCFRVSCQGYRGVRLDRDAALKFEVGSRRGDWGWLPR